MKTPALNKSLAELSPTKKRALEALRKEATDELAEVERTLPKLADAIPAAKAAALTATMAVVEAKRPLSGILNPPAAAWEARTEAVKRAEVARWAVTHAMNAWQAAKQKERSLRIAIKGFSLGNPEAGRQAGEYISGGAKGAFQTGTLQGVRGTAEEATAAAKVNAEAAEAASTSWAQRTREWLTAGERRAKREREQRIARLAEEAAAVDAARRAQRTPKGASNDAA